MNKNIEIESINIITIGESSVGKTSIIQKFVNNKFKLERVPTVGVDYFNKQLNINEKSKIILRIFDTAGQEKFKSLTKNFLKQAHGILFIYDITNTRTYSLLLEQISNTLDIDQISVPFIVCGNKLDLNEGRQISYFQAINDFKKFDSEVIETSAKTGENINKAFTKLVIKILEIRNKGVIAKDLEKLDIAEIMTDLAKSTVINSQNISIKNKNSKKTKRKCC